MKGRAGRSHVTKIYVGVLKMKTKIHVKLYTY